MLLKEQFKQPLNSLFFLIDVTFKTLENVVEKIHYLKYTKYTLKYQQANVN